MQLKTPLLGVWKFDESPEELLTMLDDYTAHYLPALENMHTDKRRQEWLGSRVALKAVAGKELLVSYRPGGAPYVEGLPQSLSISHTKGYAAVMLCDHPYAGIDIEYRSDRVKKIRSRYMSDQEEAAIDVAHEVEHLLIHWCAKEALFKMIGQEEVDFIRHLHVAPFTYDSVGSFSVYETRTSFKRSFRMEYRVEEDFVLVWSLGEE